MRWVTATRMFATAMPVLVKRSSGSSTRLPTMVVWLPPAMPGVFLPGAYNVDTLGYEERVAAEGARTQPGRPVRPAGRRGSAAVGVAVALLALLL
jgi:hypothetical protein